MSVPSVVRPAHPDDYEEVWKLARLMHKENALFSMTEAKVDWIINRVLHPHLIPQNDTGMRGFLGVIGKPGALEAFILLVVASYWYSDEIHIEELATFVHPNHRRSKHAQALLNYSKKLSDDIKIPLLIGVVSNKRTESKVRLYRKHFTESGAFFLYNCKTGRDD